MNIFQNAQNAQNERRDALKRQVIESVVAEYESVVNALYSVSTNEKTILVKSLRERLER
jgi:hypothetical protein